MLKHETGDLPPYAETVHRFSGGLVGVLTKPKVQSCDVVVLLLNAGLVQRSGPFRGYVQLARALASQGIAVFRFDQSGIGDSTVSKQVDNDRTRSEVFAAMELVGSETGLQEFILGGICSGADDAFRVAASGEKRVVGMLLLDGPGYRTPGFWVRYCAPVLINPVRLGHALWRGLKRSLPGKDAVTVESADFRDFPGRAPASGLLRDLVGRGGSALFVYTYGAYYYFNHAGQFTSMLGAVAKSPRLAMHYWPDCDHTFYLRKHRERLHAAVIAWVQENFPAKNISNG